MNFSIFTNIKSFESIIIYFNQATNYQTETEVIWYYQLTGYVESCSQFVS